MNELTRAVVLLAVAVLKRAAPDDPRLVAELTALLVTLHERVEDVAYSRTTRGTAALERADEVLTEDTLLKELPDA